jgi:hypothetical protein
MALNHKRSLMEGLEMIVEMLKLFPMPGSEDIIIGKLFCILGRNIGITELLDALLAVEEAAN